MIVVHCQSALWSDPPGKHCDVDVTYMLFHTSNLSTQCLGHNVSISKLIIQLPDSLTFFLPKINSKDSAAKSAAVRAKLRISCRHQMEACSLNLGKPYGPMAEGYFHLHGQFAQRLCLI